MTDVTLAPDVYWRLRYLQAEAEKSELQTRIRQAEFRTALMEAGVDVNVSYSWRNADTTLVAPVES